MNKFRFAAIQILSKSKTPLHAKEITKLALKKGILKTTGKTPVSSMLAQLITDVNEKGRASDFIKTNPSTFVLNKQKISKTITKKKQAKKGALVKGYLEKKDRKGLEYLLPRYKKIIGKNSGIYALYSRGKLYYVGIAENLMSRVSAHLKDKHEKKWDSVSFFVIERHRYSKDIETLILRITSPVGNGTRGKFERHYELQDKLNEVRREMKDLIKRV